MARPAVHGTPRFMLDEGALTAFLFLTFLQRLVRGGRRKLFLIVDNLKVPKAGKVEAWVAQPGRRSSWSSCRPMPSEWFVRGRRPRRRRAKRFFRRALARENTRNLRTVVTDRLKSYPGALREMKRDGELWRFARHQRGHWLNNQVEQDRRRIKRRTGPMLGFEGFWTARRTLAGIKAMAMLVKGQVRGRRKRPPHQGRPTRDRQTVGLAQ
jgi:hypothetical protein